MSGLLGTETSHGPQMGHNDGLSLTLTTQVKSSRCVSAVDDLRQRFRPYKAIPAVRDFNEQARILLPAGV